MAVMLGEVFCLWIASQTCHSTSTGKFESDFVRHLLDVNERLLAASSPQSYHLRQIGIGLNSIALHSTLTFFRPERLVRS